MPKRRAKPKTKAAPRKTGRPSVYRDEYAAQAFNYGLLGATDAQLAEFFEVDERTINRWKSDHPGFCQSLKRGKSAADARVAKSLYRRALGYSHKAVKIVADAKTGAEHVVDYIERYPPDTTAAIFWLKNRQPEQWRDQKQHEHSGAVDVNVQDLRAKLAERLARLAVAEHN